ncbi:pyridoxal phosphate-dependent aminotransferase [Desulfospira joergensenii]|uniref:pyridoxal phosphate-dependent aminotransferase n=1 Tax=Desulfospira joergensenii TaxID=53329 RepID=UPI0003B4F73B|nr:pyridoxal phosphate-dependent aminotransferase [Desulfospira joergensenii]
MSITASHLSQVKPSAVSVITEKSNQLEREGQTIIRLSAGEPDFGTPDHIKMAGIKALAEGKTGYPAVQGVFELREAVCRKLKRDNSLSYTPEEIVIGCGCKQVLFNAMAATLNPGDEVILPTPYWISYPNMVGINRGLPVFAATCQENRFKLTCEDLEQAITPRTRWLFINNPGNPSGAVYSEKELIALAEVLRKHPHVWILCDDIYEFLVYDQARFLTLPQIAPDLKSRTLVVNGVSKAYAMTGWRVGYGAGPKELIKTMFKIQSQSTSGTSSISQWASIEALDGDHSFIEKNIHELKRRRDVVVSLLNQVEGLSCESPEGAFYCYISCKGVIGKKTPKGKTIASDLDFSTFLLEECGVAVVHGEAFGLSPYFRISFATKMELLESGCRKIADACRLLKD